MKLLEKAKSFDTNSRIHFKKEFTEEEKELVDAWVNDEISINQMTKALDFNNNQQTHTFLIHYFKRKQQDETN